MNFLPDISNLTHTAQAVISVALMLFGGFAMTRLTKRLRLPNVTAYILCGILMGPGMLDLIPHNIVLGMDFLSDIALAFIAFGIGEFFRFAGLKENGPKVLVITLLECAAAAILVFCVSYFILRLDLLFSIILAALATATSPASTAMTIRQTGAKGDFVNTLLQVVALDGLVGLLTYSTAISAAVSVMTGKTFDPMSVFSPLLINLGVLLLGALFGYFMKLLMPQKRSTDNRLIISIALLFTFCAVCTILDISPLLGCMSMGTVYINITDDDKLFRQLNYFSPPILLLFFVRSGLNFRINALGGVVDAVGAVPLILIALTYFLMRVAGKYAGSYLGALITGKPKSTRRYIGLALIPQAGVAIGLAALGERSLGGEVGSALLTVILATSVLYELIGPACAKLSLYLSSACSDKIEDLVTVEPLTSDGREKNEVELLIERIRSIQDRISQHDQALTEDEQAYNEASLLSEQGHSEDGDFGIRYTKPFLTPPSMSFRGRHRR